MKTRFDFIGIRVAKFDGLRKIVPSVNMDERKGDAGRVKRLTRKVRHDNGIFSSGKQQTRVFELRRSFAKNEYRFCLKLGKVTQIIIGHKVSKLIGFNYLMGNW